MHRGLSGEGVRGVTKIVRLTNLVLNDCLGLGLVTRVYFARGITVEAVS